MKKRRPAEEIATMVREAENDLNRYSNLQRCLMEKTLRQHDPSQSDQIVRLKLANLIFTRWQSR